MVQQQQQRSRRLANVGLAAALLALWLAHAAADAAALPATIVDYGEDDDAGECITLSCEDPVAESFFSYHTCCYDACCHKYRFWVIPAGIASVGFVAGAFFALCFQCRD